MEAFTEISVRICIPNKTENVNLNVFNFIRKKKINQKHSKNIYHMNVTVNLTVKDVIQIKLGIKVNIRVSLKIQEKVCARKILFGILLHGRHTESIIGNSVIMCNDIIETTKSSLAKTVPAKSISINLNEKNS